MGWLEDLLAELGSTSGNGGGGTEGLIVDPSTGAYVLPSGKARPGRLDLSPEIKADNAITAAKEIMPGRTLTKEQDAQFRDLAIKAANEGQSVVNITGQIMAALEKVPGPKPIEGQVNGLPEGFSTAVVDGHTVLFSPTGAQILSSGPQQTTAQENASNASAAASYAAAQTAAAQTALTNLKRQTLEDIHSGKIKPPAGFIYDADGNLVDTTASSLNAGKLQALEAIKSGAIKAPAGYQYNPVTGSLEDVSAAEINKTLAELRKKEVDIRAQEAGNTAIYQQGQIGIGQEGNRLRGVSDENTRLYQQGQLANDTSRLGIEQARAQAQTLSEQQQNLLKMQEYRRQVLSNPSDFIARAFTQRGEASPSAPITPGDLLNQLASEYNNLKPGQTLTPPAAGTPGAPAPVPALAMGGMVNDPMMIVGDPQHPGRPNPEVIHNPTGAPISVTPMNRLGGRVPQYAEGTPQAGSRLAPQIDPETKAIQTKIESVGKLLQHVDSAETQHQLVDEIAANKAKLSPPQGGESIPAYADGTPDYDRVDWGSLAPTPKDTYQGRLVDKRFVGLNPKGKYYSLEGQPIYENMLDAETGWRSPKPDMNQTQMMIENTAEANLAPAVRDLFGQNFGKRLSTANTTPNPQQTGATPIRFPFALFSPQQLSELTTDELKALNSYLGVKYNTTLQDVTEAQQQVFGRSPGTQRYGRLG